MYHGNYCTSLSLSHSHTPPAPIDRPWPEIAVPLSAVPCSNCGGGGGTAVSARRCQAVSYIVRLAARRATEQTARRFAIYFCVWNCRRPRPTARLRVCPSSVLPCACAAFCAFFLCFVRRCHPSLFPPAAKKKKKKSRVHDSLWTGLTNRSCTYVLRTQCEEHSKAHAGLGPCGWCQAFWRAENAVPAAALLRQRRARARGMWGPLTARHLPRSSARRHRALPLVAPRTVHWPAEAQHGAE